MDFITDNIIWAIIIVIVVLMAIVGYIADKTDFGRKEFERKVKPDKPKKEKIKKEKPKKEKKEEIVEEMPIIVENSNDESLGNADSQMNTTDLSFNDINSQDLDQNDNSQNYEEEVQLENVNTFDLNQGVVDTSNESLENETIDQSLFEPLPSIDQVFSTTSLVEEVDSNNQMNDTSLTDNDNQSEVQSDDDIWKF